MIKKRYVSKQSMLIYKELLTNIALNRQARQEAGEYEGFNVGKSVIPEKYVDDSLIQDLTVLTKKDGYNFSSHYIQKAYDGNVYVLFVINDEPREIEAQKKAQIKKRIQDANCAKENKGNCKIISIVPYLRRFNNK